MPSFYRHTPPNSKESKHHFLSTVQIRTRLSFSVRITLALITVFAVWLGFEVRRAQQQRAAIRLITDAGAFVDYSYRNAMLGWLDGWNRNGHQYIPSDYLVEVYAISFPSGTTRFEERRGREFLIGIDYKHVPFTALASLVDLPSLTELQLSGTDIEDRDLPSITRLNGLRKLDLKGTKITNAGLEKIKTMQSLEYLDVRETWIDKDGAEMIAHAFPGAIVLAAQTPRAD